MSDSGGDHKEEKKAATAFVEELPWDTLTRVPPAKVFPGMSQLSGVAKLLPNPSGPTLQTRLAALGTEEFSFFAATFPKPLGRSVLGWSPKSLRLREFDLVLLPKVLSKGIAWATAYFRVVVGLLIIAFIAGLVASQAAGDDFPEYAEDEIKQINCYYEASFRLDLYGEYLQAYVWQVCGYDTEGLTPADYLFAHYLDCNLNLEFFGVIPSEGEVDPQLQAAGTALKSYNQALHKCDQQARYKVYEPPGGIKLTGIFAGGLVLTIVVMGFLIRMHATQPGTLSFLRSLGKPDVEEFMLSYAWAKDPDEVRTVAKAIWNSGVGCWIDVVKLVPGDQIRPVVRSMVNRVYRVVVFLSKKYITSANCAVELAECVQNPEKLIICHLEELGKEVDDYFVDMQKEFPKMRICRGWDALLPILDGELAQLPEEQNKDAYKWWQKQNITIAGAPDEVVPGEPIPKWALTTKLIDYRNDVYVGPVFLSGDCKTSGTYFCPPVLFIGTVLGLILVLVDCYNAMNNIQSWVYIIFIILILVALVPFFELPRLFDTRRLYVHPSLKPLIASHSFSKERVKVYVCGPNDSPLVQSLRHFFRLLGNGAPADMEDKQSDVHFQVPKNSMKIVVCTSLEGRNEYLGGDPKQMLFELENSVLLYDSDQMPFGSDPIGKVFAEYMVLLCADQGQSLAKSILAAVSTKVVQITHKGEAGLK